MKAISLWQPWASLVVLGAKKIESRSWPTNYRGPLLIHAAKKNDHVADELVRNTIRAALYDKLGAITCGYWWEYLPFGGKCYLDISVTARHGDSLIDSLQKLSRLTTREAFRATASQELE